MTSSSIKAGDAFIEIALKDQVGKGLRQLSGKMKAFGAGVGRLGTKIAGLGALFAAPIAAATKAFADLGDQFDKMSARVGVSVEKLSALSFAAEQSGTDAKTLEKAFDGLSRNLFDLERGAGDAKPAFEKLGISFRDLKSLAPDEQLKLIADRMQGLATETEKGAVAQKIFGRAGRAIIPLLNAGSKGIKTLTDQAAEFGIVIGKEDAEAAARMTDALNLLSKATLNFVGQIGAAVSGDVEKFAQDMARTMKAAIDWVKENRALIVSIAKIATVVLATGVALKALGITISIVSAVVKGFSATIGATSTVMTALKTNAIAAQGAMIGLKAVGIIGLVVAIGKAIEAFTGFNDKMKESINLTRQLMTAEDRRRALNLEEARNISDVTERRTELNRMLKQEVTNRSALADNLKRERNILAKAKKDAGIGGFNIFNKAQTEVPKQRVADLVARRETSRKFIDSLRGELKALDTTASVGIGAPAVPEGGVELEAVPLLHRQAPSFAPEGQSLLNAPLSGASPIGPEALPEILKSVQGTFSGAGAKLLGGGQTVEQDMLAELRDIKKINEEQIRQWQRLVST